MAGTPLFELILLSTGAGILCYAAARAAKAARDARDAARIRVRVTDRRR
ncbi:hypothetical protein [Rhodospirillum sp. A1_3_36]